MIKKIIIILFIFFSFSFSVFAESIKNYEVNIELKKDSSIIVEEKISYDFGNLQKHGIFRFIPIRFSVKGQEKLAGLMERKIEISRLEVYRDGKKENIAEIIKDDSNGNYFIKIGSQYKTYNGIHNYIIKYKVAGLLRYFEDYDEIYWNAIGLDWPVSIEKVSVKVKSENIEFKNKSCYQGKLFSKDNCDISGNIFNSTKVLNSGEGLSIALSFDKNLVAKNEIWVLSKKGFWLSLLGILSVFFGGIFMWGKSYLNKFNPQRPVIPIYKPYKNYHPAITGFLIDKKFDVQDITAGILSLAQKGYIKINRVEEKGILFGTNVDYIFDLKVSINEIGDELDKMFLDLIFSEDKNSFKNISKLFTAFNGKISSIEGGDSLTKSVKLSDLSSRAQDIQIQKQLISDWLTKYSTKNRILQKFSMKNIGVILLIIFFGMMILLFVGYIKIGIILFGLYFVIFILMAILNLRYTKKGWEIKNDLEGFKLFLEMTEKERIEFFNSPETNPQEFLDYLPYATAFGVEEKWKEQFKNITIPKPDWYSGKEPFVASAMMHDISTMAESINSTVATTASSGSGSGGGGFSGGGGGGGGGGSW